MEICMGLNLSKYSDCGKIFHMSQPSWHCMANFINTLRPRQHGRHFADDSFKRIFFNENVGISIKISLKFVHKGPINNIPALVQIMAWRRPGDKPLSEPNSGEFTDAYMRHLTSMSQERLLKFSWTAIEFQWWFS